MVLSRFRLFSKCKVMAVYITTKAGANAIEFLALIKKGTGKTWAYEQTTGLTYTASSDHWNTGGHLSLKVLSDTQQSNLVFKQEQGSPIQLDTYGILNGRFVSMILNHFSNSIERITVRDRR
jgi:hypothetical protein